MHTVSCVLLFPRITKLIINFCINSSLMVGQVLYCSVKAGATGKVKRIKWRSFKTQTNVIPLIVKYSWIVESQSQVVIYVALGWRANFNDLYLKSLTTPLNGVLSA